MADIAYRGSTNDELGYNIMTNAGECHPGTHNFRILYL